MYGAMLDYLMPLAERDLIAADGTYVDAVFAANRESRW